MKHFKSIGLQLLLLFSFLLSDAQNEVSKLDHFILKKMEQSDRIGLQAAYISNGELTWFNSYGEKMYESNSMVNDSTIFMVASISKPVTALAIMKLYDEELLDLDDPINKYLPFEVKNPNFPNTTITIRMLLSHVSSIRDNWSVLEKGYTIDDGGDSKIGFDEHLRSYLLPGGKYYNAEENYYKSAPGKEMKYNNVAFSILAYITEQITRKPFNVFMKEEVFLPLKMNNTYWLLAEIPHDNIASPHNMPYGETDYEGTQVLRHFGYPGYASGQLRTCVSDYAQFLKLMINGGLVDGYQFIKKETVDEFLKVQYPDIDKHQAISWDYNEVENFFYYLLMPRYPSHSGLDPGMHSFVSFDPKTKTGVLIFSNSPTTTFRSEKIIYLDIVRRLFKEARKAS